MFSLLDKLLQKMMTYMHIVQNYRVIDEEGGNRKIKDFEL